MAPILGIWASGAQPAQYAGSFESIATVTVGSGGSSTISFSSIPSTYTHLQLRVMLRTNNANTGDNIRMRINSDTGTNYSWHWLVGNGSSASAGGGSNETFSYVTQAPAANTASNIFGVMIIDFLDYANTNKYKTYRTLGGNDQNSTDGQLLFVSGSWRNTNAITSLSFFGDSTNIQQYSSFALYGIKGS